jgi:hypothetical protein
MTDARKVFMHRLKESCLQRFKENLHLPFLNVPMHLKKKIIHDMEIEFEIGWSAKKIKKTNDSKLQEISLQPNEKDKRNSSRAKEQKKAN